MAIRKKVAGMRVDYSRHSLTEDQALGDPVLQFEEWFQDAVAQEVPEANAMTLATAADGRPSARIVLLKGFDERGFIFYTNYESRKGREMADNPFAALVFFWKPLERQVRIEGRIRKVSAAESDAYYQSREKGSRLGAWASPQSEVISNREALEKKVQEVLSQYADTEDIPRPPHWGGYLLEPQQIEFWQGRSSRLHDRLLYTREATGDWKIERLAP